jgi:hypothetical protein
MTHRAASLPERTKNAVRETPMPAVSFAVPQIPVPVATGLPEIPTTTQFIYPDGGSALV